MRGLLEAVAAALMMTKVCVRGYMAVDWLHAAPGCLSKQRLQHIRVPMARQVRTA